MHTTCRRSVNHPKWPPDLAGHDDGNRKSRAMAPRHGRTWWTNQPALGKNRGALSVKASLSLMKARHTDIRSPYVWRHETLPYKTTDFGHTWTPLITPASGVTCYATSLTEDTRQDFCFWEPSSGCGSPLMAAKLGHNIRGTTFRQCGARHRYPAAQLRPGDG